MATLRVCVELGEGRCGTREIIWEAVAIVWAGDGGTLDKAVDRDWREVDAFER